MAESITVNGTIATEPRHLVTAEGLDILSFRLAAAQRYLDRKTGLWADGGTNWYGVAAYRGLAGNGAKSLRKGDRVIVRGRIRIRDWEKDGKQGREVEIEADSLGHDLLWGTSVYTKGGSAKAAAPAAAAPREAPGAPEEADERPAVLAEDAFLPEAAVAVF